MSLYQNRYRKSLKYGRLLASIAPFIRMIALTGSMATDGGKTVTEKSDIDFFIQVEKRRIWTARFFSTALIWILGQKRHDRGSTKKIAGRFCLNWYGIENLPRRRGYQYVAMCHSEAVRQIGGRAEESRAKTNEILHRHSAVQDDQIVARVIELILSGKFGDRLENIFRKYQIKRIERDPRTHQPDSKVRYGDEEIGLHPISNKS